MTKATSKLTEAQRSAYVEAGGTNCPHCGSGDLEGTEREFSGSGAASQEISCLACGGVWVDCYTLSSILVLD